MPIARHLLRQWRIGWIFLVPLAVASLSMAGTCPNGMVSYWRFGEEASPFYDAINTPVGNNALCVSRCPSSLNDGVAGKAVRFSVSDATGLEVPGTHELIASGTQSFTIELWVRSGDSTGDFQILVGRGETDFFWNISILPSQAVRFTMHDRTQDIVLESNKKVSAAGSALGSRWHHIAVTRNGTSGLTQLFMDGLREGHVTKVLRGVLSSDVTPLVIGWSGDANNALRFNGSLDEVAICNRVLAPQEIRSHYYLARHYCKSFDTPVGIMPIGDSITYDNYSNDSRPIEERISYRYTLWQLLSDNGFSFDFIGSEQSGQDYTAFDPDNAGFPGIRPSDLALLLETSYNHQPEPASPGHYVGDATSDTPYLKNFPCDVMLLHVGTVQLYDTAVIPAYVEGVRAILSEVDRYSPHVTVLVAKIIHKVSDITSADPTGKNSVTHLYNRALEQMVAERVAAGDKLIVVDMENGAELSYVLGEDMLDDLHPTESGYSKMAAEWYAQLIRFISPVESEDDDQDDDNGGGDNGGGDKDDDGDGGDSGGGGGGGCFIQIARMGSAP